MTIDNNEAYNFLRGLAERKAIAETRYHTLLSLNEVKNNPAIDDKIEEARTNMYTIDNLFNQFKCICNLQPSEEVEINAIIAKVYNDYISIID